MSTIECYKCHKWVPDLKAHKLAEHASDPRKPRERAFISDKPQPNVTSFKGNRTVECYDCHAQVEDLGSHRHRCPANPKNVFQATLYEQATTSTSVEVRTFEKTRKPLSPKTKDVYVLLDVSGSMKGFRLDEAKRAVREVHRIIGDHDRLAIMTFDSKVFFKLKPRSNIQIRKQNELPALLDRIFAQGGTALYDAVYTAIEQTHDKTRETLFVVLTDGQDNASQHSLAEVTKLVEENPAITLDLVEIGSAATLDYTLLAQKGRGTHTVVVETEIVTVITQRVTKVFSSVAL